LELIGTVLDLETVGTLNISCSEFLRYFGELKSLMHNTTREQYISNLMVLIK